MSSTSRTLLKHLTRLLQSLFSYLRCSNTKLKSLKEIIKMGYAYLDKRHWFYPTKYSLLKILKEEGFTILEINHIFSKRLNIYAQK